MKFVEHNHVPKGINHFDFNGPLNGLESPAGIN